MLYLMHEGTRKPFYLHEEHDMIGGISLGRHRVPDILEILGHSPGAVDVSVKDYAACCEEHHAIEEMEDFGGRLVDSRD